MPLPTKQQHSLGYLGQHYVNMGVFMSCLAQTARWREHFVFVPSQWEMMLHCNIISHWLDSYTKWSLWCVGWEVLGGRRRLEVMEGWAHLNIKTVFPGMGICIIKIRWSCLIFMMENASTCETSLYWNHVLYIYIYIYCHYGKSWFWYNETELYLMLWFWKWYGLFNAYMCTRQ